MKGDFTRSTFDRTRHYRSVRMQQGRVQVDVDWNEQMDIASDRIETEALDLIGPSGGPLHHDGFHIVAAIAALNADEQARPENQAPLPLAPKGDFYISGGRYYVDGILCENEHIVPFTQQPDLPDTNPLSQSGVYIAYLDVWPRHVTALDDPLIREVALGGPDTATRAKNIAQVKTLRVGNAGANINCLSTAADWNALIAPPSARLRARTQPSAVSNNPCIIEPGAGYRRLENQLYRVEIHKPGAVGTATFKWSRDNGSIVTSWLSQNVDELTVGNIGRDAVLRFSGGQWVELTDDTHELNGRPGTIVRLVKAEGQVLTIDSTTAIPAGPIAFADFPLNPKVRRWDSSNGVDTVSIPGGGSGGYLALEDGIEIRFQAGAIHNTGDYWLIPARTATGDIEWPGPPNAPLPLPPHGIQHHYCRLALLDFNGTTFTNVTDCRDLFPPITEMTNFFYLSGDGQEATPDPTQPAALLPLAQPLRVGVANGEWPVAGARVQFKILLGTGKVQGVATSEILTGADGVATCPWELDSTTSAQQVEARLLNAGGNSIHLPVRFNANLSTAAKVSYDPKSCANLAGSKTVQEALDILCKLSGTGSSCCVTVGKDGDFQLLDAAVKELLKDKTDICICLMPGDHKLTDGLVITADPKKPVHLRISGSGRGSRIVLSNKSIQATGLASFTLRDLCVFTEGKAISNPIAVSACVEVSIAGCHLKQEIAPTDLLTIAKATRIDISDNVIESWFVDGKLLDELAKIFGLKMAPPVASGPTLAFQELSLQFARVFANSTDQKRVALLKEFKKLADKTAATHPFRKAADRTIQEITPLNFQPQFRVDSIGLLAASFARLLTAPAVVVADANAETAIIDNIITGEVRFYGTNNAISKIEFDKIINLVVKPGKLPAVKGQERCARIEGNSLTQVVAALALGTQVKIANGFFGRISFLDNTFHTTGNQWMARHVISNGNNFALLDDATAGTATGASFICLGTSADMPLSKLLYGVPNSTVFRESANLIKLVPI